jgi:hypothetical protein
MLAPFHYILESFYPILPSLPCQRLLLNELLSKTRLKNPIPFLYRDVQLGFPSPLNGYVRQRIYPIPPLLNEPSLSPWLQLTVFARSNLHPQPYQTKLL